jgi:hypothetical protein
VSHLPPATVSAVWKSGKNGYANVELLKNTEASGRNTLASLFAPYRNDDMMLR